MITKDDRQAILDHLQHGSPLPPTARSAMFALACAAQNEQPHSALPQNKRVMAAVEHANPCALSPVEPSQNIPVHCTEHATHQNLLYHGNNKELLQELAAPAGQAWLQTAGGLRFIYLDPPFNVGSDFFATLQVGTAEQTFQTLRHKAYTDTWPAGGFLSMLHERLVLARQLLSPEGTIVVHCDWRTTAHIRLMLDAIFGPQHFLGEIIWHYTGGGRATRYFSRKHDTLLHYAKTDRWHFDANAVRVPYEPTSGYAKKGIKSKAGKLYTPHPEGTLPDDVWRIPIINPLAAERLGYPTQKPEALLERLILACTRPGDLLADFFCGSGTTLAVAQRLGRKWIGADQNALGIALCEERLASQSPPENTGFTLCTHLDPELSPAAGKECHTSSLPAFFPCPLAPAGQQPREGTHPCHPATELSCPPPAACLATNYNGSAPTIACKTTLTPAGVQVTFAHFSPLPQPEDAMLHGEGNQPPPTGEHWAIAWAVAPVPPPCGSAENTCNNQPLPENASVLPPHIFQPLWRTWRSGKGRQLLLQTPPLLFPAGTIAFLVRVTDIFGRRLYQTFSLPETERP